MDTVVDPHMLRALREARGWDQQTLARHAAIDPSVVSRLERRLQGDLNASVLVALARSLDTSVDALLSTPPRPSPTELVPELAAAIKHLSRLTGAQQRHVAALLRAYVAALPEQQATD